MSSVSHVLLQGIVGSTAYGLAGPDSDVDRMGVFAFPTKLLHGLRNPADSHVTTSPDVTMHEARKFASLCLKCNPSVTELLWLPDDLYEVREPLAAELIEIRSAFLSAGFVKNAYFGYAVQQFQRLRDRGDGSFSADTRKRTAKHARHLARLLHQGVELYHTGTLSVRLTRPEWYIDFGERVAQGDLALAQTSLDMAQAAFQYGPAKLPDAPDENTVEQWLLRVRHAYYTVEQG